MTSPIAYFALVATVLLVGSGRPAEAQTPTEICKARLGIADRSGNGGSRRALLDCISKVRQAPTDPGEQPPSATDQASRRDDSARRSAADQDRRADRNARREESLQRMRERRREAIARRQEARDRAAEDGTSRRRRRGTGGAAAEAPGAASPRPTASGKQPATGAPPAAVAVARPTPELPAEPGIVTPKVVERRIALVIGNGRYAHAPELRNPVNDATDVASALRALGFEVQLATDLDYIGFRAAIDDLANRQVNADVALFFYAGHGLQVGGKNYLVPVDAKVETASELERNTFTVDTILGSMEQPERTNLVILDACRDNPLTRSLRRSLPATRSSAVGQGLAPIRTAGGSLIAFATDPDNVALDSSGGRNSPFTSALLNHISRPGLEIESMLKRVRVDVMKATRNTQTPWSNSSLLREVFLAGDPPVTR